jgi:hypothetical protein
MIYFYNFYVNKQARKDVELGQNTIEQLQSSCFKLAISKKTEEQECGFSACTLSPEMKITTNKNP